MDFDRFLRNHEIKKPARRLTIFRSSDELPERLAPDDDAIVGSGIDRWWQWKDKVLERPDITDSHHIRLQAVEVRLRFNEIRRIPGN